MNFNPRARRPFGSPTDIAARALNELGGVKRAASLLGRSVSTAGAWTLESSPNEIPYSCVQTATRLGAQAFAEDLAALAGGLFVPPQSANNDFGRLLATAAASFGRFTAVCIVSPPRAAVDLAQAAQFRADLDETIRALVAARECLTQATAGAEHVRN